MTIHYQCRHCQTKVGQLEGRHTSEQLGLHHLTEEERASMVTYNDSGDMTIHVICEDCHEAYIRNPNLYELDVTSHIQ
ncbi:anti-sigma-F factor Fin family protein [Halalkalibacterium halodurans]|uniref:Peptide ABC transporter permease n=1 Tax=Halalkalibacterium halodurans TaxID=86665 RepID=A0A0M0KCM5_ALKHA|nr:anti-sigma-F factor Fin family protein [Halalkalibacterium halodurans]MDY7220571.1 anti-sigma-F factor Fin family protein [Halalkalibacterium halodurans]MDY7239810.1 anti-sigma-F factor Fin family protein [Halalkalibacterium halodurans]MED3646103.1 anti-sigma-F factor Fin family protein [Halalkalibacterium halodurans]MED4080421.1 anti-sigma-F factor Fin family protein [Halalkalibacterium halodurans]MED4085602.1 anti-sigma-F factor Fin family protein [Halalkalibacterium halodurans]